MDDKTKRELWNEKEQIAIFLGKEVTWEDFLIERRIKDGRKSN